MAEMYRGLSQKRGNDMVAGREQIAATSNGEFGNGSYYWKDDLAAGIISALQYYGQADGGWAVMRVTVDNAQLGNIPRASILNFKSIGGDSDFDASTGTAKRNVAIDQFGGQAIKMNFAEFREINADPSGHGLVGEKNQLTWPNYNIIAGPTAAAPKEVNLVQIKFAAEGINMLNAANKAIVICGAKLNDKTYQTVRSWKLEDRKSIYEKYFAGHDTVNLVL